MTTPTTDPLEAGRKAESRPECPHDSIEELRAALERDEVTFPMAMKALYLQRPEWNDNEASRRRYCELYPKLCEAFIRNTDGLRESLYANQYAAGVALTKDCELFTAIWWEDFPFNTAPARVLEAEISDLRIRAELYLSGEPRKICMQRVLRLYIGLISTLRREWKRHNPDASRPSGQMAAAVSDEGTAARGLGAEKEGGAPTGAARDGHPAAGPVVIVAVAGLVAALLSNLDHTIWLGALAGGAVGGLLSVLERYTRGRLVLQYEAETLWLKGVLRPVVGALSGLALYVLITAGFLPLGITAEGPSLGLAFTGLGLLAGFSERLLKDMMEKASASSTREERQAEAAAAEQVTETLETRNFGEPGARPPAEPA